MNYNIAFLMKQTILYLRILLIVLSMVVASCGQVSGESVDADLINSETVESVDDAAPIQSEKSTMVWICNSTNTKRYHANKSCGGLKRCKHEIVRKSIAEAEAVGLTLCNMSKCANNEE